jgi:hypothetical protein
MTSHKPTAHLLRAGIAGIGAALAIAVAVVGPVSAALSGPVVNEALQPGQTDSFVASGDVSGSIGGATISTTALGPTEALQPGQTDSLTAPGNVSASAGGPTEALQPGQSDSGVPSGDVSGSIGGATISTSAVGPASAPQPGQTGW